MKNLRQVVGIGSLLIAGFFLTGQSPDTSRGGGGSGCNRFEIIEKEVETEVTVPVASEEQAAIVLYKDESNTLNVPIADIKNISSLCFGSTCENVSWLITADSTTQAASLQAATGPLPAINPAVTKLLSNCEDEKLCKGLKAKIHGPEGFDELAFVTGQRALSFQLYFPQHPSLFGASNLMVWVAPTDIQEACEADNKTIAECDLPGIDSAKLNIITEATSPILPSRVKSLQQLFCGKSQWDVTTANFLTINDSPRGTRFNACVDPDDWSLHLLISNPELNPPVGPMSFSLLNPEIETIVLPQDGTTGCPSSTSNGGIIRFRDGSTCDPNTGTDPRCDSPGDLFGADILFNDPVTGDESFGELIDLSLLEDRAQDILTAVGINGVSSLQSLGIFFENSPGIRQLLLLQAGVGGASAGAGIINSLLESGFLSRPDDSPYSLADLLECGFKSGQNAAQGRGKNISSGNSLSNGNIDISATDNR